MQRGCPLGHGDIRQLLIALQMGSKCEFVGVSCDSLLYFAVSGAVLCCTLDICFFLESMRCTCTFACAERRALEDHTAL